MPARSLADILEERRDAVEALPGVIGTAVGASAKDAGAGESAIHVYVAPDAEAERVRAEAERLLEGAPVELLDMERPEAQPND
jgi:hypothetical protein